MRASIGARLKNDGVRIWTRAGTKARQCWDSGFGQGWAVPDRQIPGVIITSWGDSSSGWKIFWHNLKWMLTKNAGWSLVDSMNCEKVPNLGWDLTVCHSNLFVRWARKKYLTTSDFPCFFAPKYNSNKCSVILFSCAILFWKQDSDWYQTEVEAWNERRNIFSILREKMG